MGLELWRTCDQFRLLQSGFERGRSEDPLRRDFPEITSSAGHPTEVEQGYNPSTSGYITFTDQLGDYMKVDSFTTIVFAKQLFQNSVKSTSGNVDTYTFSGEAGNVLYPSGNLSSIVITSDQVGQSGDG